MHNAEVSEYSSLGFQVSSSPAFQTQCDQKTGSGNKAESGNEVEESGNEPEESGNEVEEFVNEARYS